MSLSTGKEETLVGNTRTLAVQTSAKRQGKASGKRNALNLQSRGCLHSLGNSGIMITSMHKLE